MKKLSALSLAALVQLSQPANAVNPHQGPYLGLMAGVSNTPGINLTIPNYVLNNIAVLAPNNLLFNPARLSFRTYGGIAASLGYRLSHLRFEGELLFNYNPNSKLSIGNLRLDGSKRVTGLRIKGSRLTEALLLNGFYDFYTPGNDCFLVPYLGLGVGYAKVKNRVNFYNANLVLDANRISNSHNATAIQGVLGFSYFLDDFTSMSLDYRYLGSHQKRKAATLNDEKLRINSINLGITTSLDCF